MRYASSETHIEIDRDGYVAAMHEPIWNCPYASHIGRTMFHVQVAAFNCARLLNQRAGQKIMKVRFLKGHFMLVPVEFTEPDPASRLDPVYGSDDVRFYNGVFPDNQPYLPNQTHPMYDAASGR
jgi:hypothetical protein